MPRRWKTVVALKFVTSEFTDDSEYREGFSREVEAAAGLSHLGIVTVHDSGTVDELVSLASDGELPTGSPWLAMEFARYGNLADVVIESWSELRVVLYDILDALAHAHSRGASTTA